jgi:adiponectin receptor
VPVPEWQHLPLTLRGYRVSHDVYAAAFSALTVHLDTVNIWSHVLGLVYYLAMVPYTLSELRANGASWLDVALFLLYLACGASQMLSSSLYHLFRAVRHLDDFYLTLDIWGILAMIGGSWALGMGQGFHCAPGMGAAYLAVELLLLAAGREMGSRALAGRVSWEAYYVVMGSAVAFGAAPLTHIYLRCENAACASLMARACVGMFGNYFLGYITFTARFPERLAPGLFDILGHSHQWWHLFVWNAGRVWLLTMIESNKLKGEGRLGPACPAHR